MKVRLILAGLLLAQLADAASFAIGIARLGIGAEANGWMRVLYEAGGLPAVMALKGGASLGLLGFFSNTLAIALARG